MSASPLLELMGLAAVMTDGTGGLKGAGISRFGELTGGGVWISGSESVLSSSSAKSLCATNSDCVGTGGAV